MGFEDIKQDRLEFFNKLLEKNKDICPDILKCVKNEKPVCGMICNATEHYIEHLERQLYFYKSENELLKIMNRVSDNIESKQN